MAAGRSDDPFPRVLDQVFPVGSLAGNSAFFGRDVLRGLVDGINDFAACRQPRWRGGSRVIGPALLGCSPWVTDTHLVAALRELSGACVVISKRPKTRADTIDWQRMRRLNKQTPGVPVRAFPQLAWMAPSKGGEPVVFGPGDEIDDQLSLSTFRTIGHRKMGSVNPPLAHAKLALLGHLWWHDEDALGYPDDVFGFRPLCLWVSSANFTLPSRRSLEFGFWTEEPALLDGAYKFLGQLMASSEDLDAVADAPDPELVRVDLDMEAMADYAAEFWQPDDDEP